MDAASLIQLANHPDVRRITTFGEVAERLRIDDIAAAYQITKSDAPRRYHRDKTYFGAREGTTSSGAMSNRREEHLAVAMFNRSRSGTPFRLPDGRSLEFIDYQTPLKARQDDKGVGKVDLRRIPTSAGASTLCRTRWSTAAGSASCA